MRRERGASACVSCWTADNRQTIGWPALPLGCRQGAHTRVEEGVLVAGADGDVDHKPSGQPDGSCKGAAVGETVILLSSPLHPC